MRCVGLGDGPKVGKFLDVVNEAEELPLCIDLGAPTQRETVESLVVPKITEHGFDGGEASSVGRATLFAIDAPPHVSGEVVSA